jgi:thiol-disulfide isomerase/thioredoxin
MLPKTVQPSREDYPPYYNTIVQDNKYADPDFLRFGFASELVGFYANYTLLHSGKFKERQKHSVQEVTNLFGNEKVKGIYAATQLFRFRTLEEFNQEMDPVKQYLLTDSMQALYNRLVTRLSVYKKGNPAYNFSFPDLDGKEVSMASLKGKVVLIDFWATWCAPCRAEIPYLKKLEEELKEQNIQFVSISIDEEKETWLKSVAQEKLEGMQLFAKGWGKMTLYYDINTIPRFMVFDKEGKIVTVDAPRPSDPQLKQLLLDVSQGKAL